MYLDRADAIVPNNNYYYYNFLIISKLGTYLGTNLTIFSQNVFFVDMKIGCHVLQFRHNVASLTTKVRIVFVYKIISIEMLLTFTRIN